MGKPIFSIVLAYPLARGLDGGFQGFAGAGLDGAQPRFEFAEGGSHGVEVGRVVRQVQQAGPAGYNACGQAGHFVGRVAYTLPPLLIPTNWPNPAACYRNASRARPTTTSTNP